MGCGGSRAGSDYFDQNKDKKLGEFSDFLNALELLEERHNSKVNFIKRADYSAKVKSIKGLTGQQWVIHAVYENSTNHINSVLVAEDGKTEVESAVFK